MSESLPALVTDFLTALLSEQSASFFQEVVLPELKRKSVALRKIKSTADSVKKKTKEYRSKHLPFYLSIVRNDGYGTISIDEDDVAALLVATKAKTYEGGAAVGEKGLLLTLLNMYKEEVEFIDENSARLPLDSTDSGWLELESVQRSVEYYLDDFEYQHDEDVWGHPFDREGHASSALEYAVDGPFQKNLLVDWVESLIARTEADEEPHQVFDDFTESNYPDLEGLDGFSIPWDWGSTLKPDKYIESEGGLDVLELYKGATGRRLENLRVPVSFLLDIIYGDRKTWDGKITVVDKKSGNAVKEPALKLTNPVLSFNRLFSLSVSENDAFYLFRRAMGTFIALHVKSTHKDGVPIEDINYTDKATLAAILSDGLKVSLRSLMQDTVDSMLTDIGIHEGTEDYTELSHAVKRQYQKDFTRSKNVNKIIVKDKDSILAILRTFCRRVGDSIVFGRDYVEDDLYINAQFGGFCIGTAYIRLEINSKETNRRSLKITAVDENAYLVRARLANAPSLVYASPIDSEQFLTQTPLRGKATDEIGHSTNYYYSIPSGKSLRHLPISSIELNTHFKEFSIWAEPPQLAFYDKNWDTIPDPRNEVFRINYSSGAEGAWTNTIIADFVGNRGYNTASHIKAGLIVAKSVDESLAKETLGSIRSRGKPTLVLANPREDFLDILLELAKEADKKTYNKNTSSLIIVTNTVLPTTHDLMKRGIGVFQADANIASARVIQVLSNESSEGWLEPHTKSQPPKHFSDFQYEPTGIPIASIIINNLTPDTYSPIYNTYSPLDNAFTVIFNEDGASDAITAFCGIDNKQIVYNEDLTPQSWYHNTNDGGYSYTCFIDRYDDERIIQTAVVAPDVRYTTRLADVGRSDAIYKPSIESYRTAVRKDNSYIFNSLGFKEKSAEELSAVRKIKPAKNTNFSAAFYSFILGFTALCRGREHLPKSAELVKDVILKNSIEGQLQLLGMRDFREALYSKDNHASAFNCLQNCIFWPEALSSSTESPKGQRSIYDMVITSSDLIGSFFRHYVYGLLECLLRPITLLEIHERSTEGRANPAFEYDTNTYASKGYYNRSTYVEDYKAALEDLFGLKKGFDPLRPAKIDEETFTSQSMAEYYAMLTPAEMDEFLKFNYNAKRDLNVTTDAAEATKKEIHESSLGGLLLEEPVQHDLQAARNLVATLDSYQLKSLASLSSYADGYDNRLFESEYDSVIGHRFATPDGNIFALDGIDDKLYKYNLVIEDFYKNVQPFLSQLHHFEKQMTEDWASRPQDALDKLPEYRFYTLITGNKKSKVLNKLDLLDLLKDPRTDHPVFKKIKNNPVVKGVRDGQEYKTLFTLQDAKNSVPLFFLSYYFQHNPKLTIYPNSDRPYNRMSITQYSALIIALKISYAIEMKASSYQAFGKPVATYDKYIAFQPTANEKEAISNLVKLGSSYGVCFGQEGIDYQVKVKNKEAHFLAFAESNGKEYGEDGFGISSVISFMYLNRALVSESKGQRNTIACTKMDVGAYSSYAYSQFDSAIALIADKMDKAQAAFYTEASIALGVWQGALPWSSGARKYAAEDSAWLFILLAMRELVVGEVPDSDEIAGDAYPVMFCLKQDTGWPVYPPDEDSTPKYIESFNTFKEVANTIPFGQINVTIQDDGIVNNDFWKKL